MEKTRYQCKNVISSSHSSHNLSRQELVAWINHFEDIVVKVKKVESLCSGSVYCQLVNHLFPGSLSLRKIKNDGATEYDFRQNLKQLQMAFRKVGCDTDVPIEKLIKGRFQENFEFLQWFKKFYDANSASIHTQFSGMNISGASQPDVPKKNVSNIIATTPRARAVEKPGSATKKPSEEVEQYKEKIAQLEEKSDEINKEREFYFNKLRNIEALCTSDASDDLDKESSLRDKILAELYATAEEEQYDEETY